MNITECYIILGGLDFLNVHAQSLLKLLDATMNNCFPKDAPPLINSIFQSFALTCLSGSDDANPSKAAIKASAGSILARLMVVNTDYLVLLASEPSLSAKLHQYGISLDQSVILSLVDVWLEKLDNVSFIQRKTCALALAISLNCRETQMLEKLEQIVSACTSVIIGGEEKTKEYSYSDADSLGSNNISEAFGSSPTTEIRRRQLKEFDPIKHLSLEDILRENLRVCATIHGESYFNSVMSRIHPSVLSQLRRALKMA